MLGSPATQHSATFTHGIKQSCRLHISPAPACFRSCHQGTVRAVSQCCLNVYIYRLTRPLAVPIYTLREWRQDSNLHLLTHYPASLSGQSNTLRAVLCQLSYAIVVLKVLSEVPTDLAVLFVYLFESTVKLRRVGHWPIPVIRPWAILTPNVTGILCRSNLVY